LILISIQSSFISRRTWENNRRLDDDDDDDDDGDDDDDDDDDAIDGRLCMYRI